MNLVSLIITAYDVRTYQISGAPTWAYSEAYDIAAKAPGDARLTNDRLRPMLQALLAERFGLKVRHGTKVMPVYALKVAKKGPKVKESSPDATTSVSYHMGAVTQMAFSKTSVAQFARGLSSFADRPVIDRTSLKGNYDLKLEWSSDDSQPAQDVGAPSLFTAIQEQLGLKLEPQNGPVEMLIIDRVEKPSED
jgi:uncharacterized protein (TIGR03435 family)